MRRGSFAGVPIPPPAAFGATCFEFSAQVISALTTTIQSLPLVGLEGTIQPRGSEEHCPEECGVEQRVAHHSYDQRPTRDDGDPRHILTARLNWDRPRVCWLHASPTVHAFKTSKRESCASDH